MGGNASEVGGNASEDDTSRKHVNGGGSISAQNADNFTVIRGTELCCCFGFAAAAVAASSSHQVQNCAAYCKL